jgi:hypothetical protein
MLQGILLYLQGLILAFREWAVRASTWLYDMPRFQAYFLSISRETEEKYLDPTESISRYYITSVAEIMSSNAQLINC